MNPENSIMTNLLNYFFLYFFKYFIHRFKNKIKSLNKTLGTYVDTRRSQKQLLILSKLMTVFRNSFDNAHFKHLCPFSCIDSTF